MIQILIPMNLLTDMQHDHIKHLIVGTKDNNYVVNISVNVSDSNVSRYFDDLISDISYIDHLSTALSE